MTPRTDLPHRPVIAARNFVRPLILVLVFGALLALFTSRAGQGTDLRDHLLWAGLGTVGYYIIGRIVAAVLKVLDASREALRPESFRQELHGSEVIYAVRDGRTIVSRVKQKPEPSSRKHQQGGGVAGAAAALAAARDVEAAVVAAAADRSSASAAWLLSA